MTEDDIEAGKSVKGAWTKKTLKAWGVPWPPPRGWKQKLLKGQKVYSQKKPKKKIDRTPIHPETYLEVMRMNADFKGIINDH